MWLVHEIFYLRAQPVIPARCAVVLPHPLLDDCPLALGSQEKTVMVNAESILHGGRIDLRRHSAVVGESGAVETEMRPVPRELEGRAPGRLAFSSSDEHSELVTTIGQARLERAANRRRHSARMPVETEHATERLKPVRI